jgi:hypothetical protein
MQSKAKHLTHAARGTILNDASEMLRFAQHDDLSNSKRMKAYTSTGRRL